MISRNLQRRSVTLLCFIVVNTLFASLLVYIDSYSIYRWEYETEVGPASMVITNVEGEEFVDRIRSVPYVTRAAYLKTSVASVLAFPPHHDYPNASVRSKGLINSNMPIEEDPLNTTIIAASMDPMFQENFPFIINLTLGRFPQNASEIAFEEWVARRFQVTVGAVVYYEHGLVAHTSRLRLVGIFRRDEINNRNDQYYRNSDAVVVPELLTNLHREDLLYLDVDRTFLSAANPRESLVYLTGIEENIRELDPSYAIHHHTHFFLDDIMAKGIQRYMVWLTNARITQFFRTQGFILLAIIVSGFAVRFNLNERRRDSEFFTARGASSRQIVKLLYSEILILTLLSMIFAFALGTIISRIGLICIGFFRFNGHIVNGTFLFSLNSLILYLLSGILIPSISFFVYRGYSNLKTVEEMDYSRFRRFTRMLKMIKWDGFTVLISLTILFASWEMGAAISSSPILLLLSFSTPYALFLGLGSVLTRGMKRSSEFVSKRLKGMFGLLPSSIGIRRLGRDHSPNGFAIVVVALSISLIWNSTIIGITLPNTGLSQTRFAIGGDVVFKMNTQGIHLWSQFITNVSQNPIVEDLSMITVDDMSLSADLQEKVEFVAINPLEYASVGYDAQGIPLDESFSMNFLKDLEDTPAGAILTNDIALAYGVGVGDALRAFRGNGSSVETLIFNVIGIIDALPDSMVSAQGYNPPRRGFSSIRVGRGRIWINRQRTLSYMDIDQTTYSYLCVRTNTSSLGEKLVDDILESSNTNPPVVNGFAVASEVAEEIQVQEQYIIDRSVDTVLSIAALMILPVTLLLYLVSGLNQRRKEITLLRVVGIESITVYKCVLIEVVVLILHGMFLLFVGTPFLINNSLFVTILTNDLALSSFPNPILPIIPFFPLLYLLLYVILLTGLLSLIHSIRFLKRNIISEKGSIWEESLLMREVL